MSLTPVELRQALRRRSTDAERRLWSLLRAHRAGPKFRRQHTVGPYTLDFFCPALRLAIEADGGQHREEPHAARDEVRDAYLAGQGIRVLRFSDREILLETATVHEAIWREVQRAAAPSPCPSPPLGRGRGK